MLVLGSKWLFPAPHRAGCSRERRRRSNDAKDAKVIHTATSGLANSDATVEFAMVKFLHIPGVPLAEASVSVTLTLYGPAGRPFW